MKGKTNFVFHCRFFVYVFCFCLSVVLCHSSFRIFPLYVGTSIASEGLQNLGLLSFLMNIMKKWPFKLYWICYFLKMKYISKDTMLAPTALCKKRSLSLSLIEKRDICLLCIFLRASFTTSKGYYRSRRDCFNFNNNINFG